MPNSQFNQSAPDKMVVSLNESATQPRKRNMETTEMTNTLNSINTTPHLCRSKVKQTALEIACCVNLLLSYLKSDEAIVGRHGVVVGDKLVSICDRA